MRGVACAWQANNEIIEQRIKAPPLIMPIKYFANLLHAYQFGIRKGFEGHIPTHPQAYTHFRIISASPAESI